MADELFLEIVTPYKKFFSGNVEMITLVAPDGEMGVLPGHMPLVSAVSVGPIRIKQGGETLDACVSDGFMKVENNNVILFVDSAEWPDEIDENRAKAAAERARERLRRQLDKIEYANSVAALQRAMARLKVKNGRK